MALSTLQRTVLVAEDDPKTAQLLADYLVQAGYIAQICSDGLAAIASARSTPPSAMLLDLNLSGCDGTEVCRQVRTFSAMPIIMVTARVDEVERLIGLEIGADDYICKPFSPREVMARLAATLRRADGLLLGGSTVVWRIDDEGQAIAHRDQWLPLTPVEFRLLRTFLKQPGRVFAREQLLDKAHEDFRDVSDRAIDSHVKNIRKKMASAGADPELLASIYGVGYRFSQTA